MNRVHGPVGPWRRVLVTPAILDGQPWKGRAIRNACLRRHCHQLGRTFRSGKTSLDPVRKACQRLLVVIESRSRILTEIHPNELPIVPMVIRVAAYYTRWLRLPEDWCPATSAAAREQWTDLLRHLFQCYPVPKCLELAWSERGSLEHFVRNCYCAAGAGRSVRTVAGFPPSVSHRTLHLALTESAESTFTEAIWRAQLRVLGADEKLQRKVMESRVTRDLSHHARWLSVVSRFVHAPKAVEDFGLVADALAMLEAEEGRARADRHLRAPLEELCRWSWRWWTNLLAMHEEAFPFKDVRDASVREGIRQICSMVWSRMLRDEWKIEECNDAGLIQEWKVVELCSQSALIAEGWELLHCASSYGKLCRAGHSAMFSLRLRDIRFDFVERIATVQVSTRTRRVVQIKGYRNRTPDESEMAKVRYWAQSNGLRMSRE